MNPPTAATAAGSHSVGASASDRPAAHAALMDRIYRTQRHFYDYTRKYFLIGRDRLLDTMVIRPGDRVLEVGCGTARNLRLLARRSPDGRLFGLDVSQAMLDTAAAALARRGLRQRVELRRCLAEELDARATFGLDRPFDAIFFSYTLSMIPTWRAALDAALRNLRSGGGLYVVDFWDQAELPRWFGGLLRGWLNLFHVQHRPELIDHLRGLDAQGIARLNLDSIGRRYAFLAALIKP